MKISECIVVIDPQKDFIHPEGNYAKKHPDLQQILEAKRNILSLLDLQIPLVLVYSDYSPGQFDQQLSLCVPGTVGHEMGIPVPASCAVISKTAHSAFSNNLFETFLKERAIKKIYLGGFLAEYCVRQTAIDALGRGLQVSLITDCIGTGDDVQERLREMFDELTGKGAEMEDSEQIKRKYSVD